MWAYINFVFTRSEILFLMPDFKLPLLFVLISTTCARNNCIYRLLRSGQAWRSYLSLLMCTFWKQSIPRSSCDSGSCSADWFEPRSASSLSVSSDNFWRDCRLSAVTCCYVFTCFFNVLGDFIRLLMARRQKSSFYCLLHAHQWLQ